MDEYKNTLSLAFLDRFLQNYPTLAEDELTLVDKLSLKYKLSGLKFN